MPGKLNLSRHIKKAKYQFRDDEGFYRFQKIYTQKMQEIQTARKKNTLINVLCGVGIVLGSAVVILICLLI